MKKGNVLDGQIVALLRDVEATTAVATLTKYEYILRRVIRH
jgi:hypothetical protein